MRYLLAIVFLILFGLNLPAAARPRHHSHPRASLAEWVNSLIEKDSLGWLANRYDRGSVYDVGIESQSDQGYVIAAKYTFNSGQRGWVKVQVAHDRFSCIEFWDEGVCRDLLAPLSDGSGNQSAGQNGTSNPFGGSCGWWQNEGPFGRCD